MFNIYTIAESFAHDHEKMIEAALIQKKFLDEQGAMERALGGKAMFEAMQAHYSTKSMLEEAQRAEFSLTRDTHDLMSGRTAYSEVIGNIVGETVMKNSLESVLAGGVGQGMAHLIENLSCANSLHRTVEQHSRESTVLELLRHAAKGLSMQSALQDIARDGLRYSNFNALAREREALEAMFTSTITSVSGHLSVNEALNAAMKIEKPWIDVLDPQRSFGAFWALSEIGMAISAMRVQDHASTERLRSLIGTWAPPDLSAFALLDQAQRAAAFYTSGIDPRIFDIPRNVFDDVARAAGIVQPVPAKAPSRQKNRNKKQVAIPLSGALNLDAHAQVTAVELMLRVEVSWRMSLKFGPQWKKKYIHGKVLAELRDRQANARFGKSGSPIDYTFFGELVQIIMRKDVWDAAFSDLDMTREEFRIGTDRLIEVRNAVNHGRKLDPVEFVWCFAEATRLQRAFGIPGFLVEEQ